MFTAKENRNHLQCCHYDIVISSVAVISDVQNVCLQCQHRNQLRLVRVVVKYTRRVKISNCPYELCQILVNFQNSFTAGKSTSFVTKAM